MAGRMNQISPEQPSTSDRSSPQGEPPEHADPPGRGSPVRKLLFRLLVLALGAALAFVLAEVGLRLFVPVTDVAWHFWDSVLGARVTPGQSGVYVRPGGPYGHYAFNDQGWNYPQNYVVRNEPGTLRVCVIGDSYVEAMHVELDDSLALVGQRAMTEAGVPAQWYPFALSGFGMAQYYLVLHHYVAYYHPDVVIVVLVPNDLYDSSPFLLSTNIGYTTLHVDQEGTVQLFPARRFRPSRVRRLVYSTALGRFLFAQCQIHRRRGDLREVSYRVFLRDEQGGSLLMGEGLDLEERARLSWQHAEDVMGLMRDECARMNTPLLFAYCGNIPLLNAVYEGREYSPIPPDRDPYSMHQRIWEMGTDLFGPAAHRLGVPYLDLTEPIAAEVKRSGKRHDFIDNDHYSAVGHKAAGEALARRIMAILSDRAEPSHRPGP